MDKQIEAKSPPGWKHTVERMKKHKEITNPWALSWWMKDEGYHPHKSSVIEKLVQLADSLDQRGFTAEANEVDNIVKINGDFFY